MPRRSTGGGGARAGRRWVDQAHPVPIARRWPHIATGLSGATGRRPPAGRRWRPSLRPAFALTLVLALFAGLSSDAGTTAGPVRPATAAAADAVAPTTAIGRPVEAVLLVARRLAVGEATSLRTRSVDRSADALSAGPVGRRPSARTHLAPMTRAGIASTYGPGWDGWIAWPAGPGWRLRVCGLGGCVTVVTTDAGPDLTMQRAGRVVDLDVATFEQVAGAPWTIGLTRVTVTVLGRA